MIKIDLITGFLGAGKTTFIKEYARYLLSIGDRVCIIENDYGAVNVDMVLLKDLLGDNCNLEMIIGGDGKEAHKRRFRTKLISMAMSSYTRVIIEPSGVYDVDEFFDVLYDEPLDNWYEIGSIIAIVDGSNYEELSDTSRYIMMSETAWAGKLLFTKLKQSGDEKKVLGFVNRCMEDFGCNSRFEEKDIITRNLYDISKEEFKTIKDAGYRHASYTKLPVSDGDFTSLFYFDTSMPENVLNEMVKNLFKDPNAGHVIRIKGSVRVSEDRQLEVNITENEASIKTAACNRDILIVIGEGLNKAYINKLLENYCSIVSL